MLFAGFIINEREKKREKFSPNSVFFLLSSLFLLLLLLPHNKKVCSCFKTYKNKLISHSMVVGVVSHMLCEWAYIILIMNDKKVMFIGEKDMENKLDILFNQHADAVATAEVLRKYGLHLYGKQEYDEAMSQYIQTIGHLEPSYVIQKFLDAQRIYNLANYLEQLHKKGLASKNLTTLLWNCYTKLKYVEKLNKLIKGKDSVSEQKFEVETTIRVCRSADYHEDAMYVAKILLEDLGSYQEARQYISSLELNQAGFTLKEYGKILIEHRPTETIEILMKVCSDSGETKRMQYNGTHLSILPPPMDFIYWFVHSPQSLMDFFEKYVLRIG